MDSIIMSLLHNKRGVFVNSFLNGDSAIARILNVYYNKIHNSHDGEKLNASEFKEVCNQIQTTNLGIYPHYNEDKPQDAEEFLQFIFNEIAYCNTTQSTLETRTNLLYRNNTKNTELLKPTNCKEKVPIYAFAPTTNKSVVENADPSKWISLTKLIQRGNVIVNSGIKVTENSEEFDEVITQCIIQKSVYTIVTIPRLTLVEPDFSETKKNQDVVPDETITIDGNTLTLTSIVAHLGCYTAGHYICFFNTKSGWKLYDSSMYGVANEFIEIGSFDDLLRVSNREGAIVQQCGTIFIYEKYD
tara:strand:- start:692 stop:1594 length:903 start_codon:yes stop_codon:yes gene_type:complete